MHAVATDAPATVPALATSRPHVDTDAPAAANTEDGTRRITGEPGAPATTCDDRGAAAEARATASDHRRGVSRPRSAAEARANAIEERAAVRQQRSAAEARATASDERAAVGRQRSAAEARATANDERRGVGRRLSHADSPRHAGDAGGGSGAAARLTEKQLELLWHGRRFPDGALVTRQGVPVRVIYQGRRGRGPGPDFRGAVIAGPSAVPVRGDVELHVRSSDFRAHNHHRDAAYRNIVLHVVFNDDAAGDGGATPLPGGGSAPVIALAPWVAQRAGELEQWIARPLLWREPCHDAVMRLGSDGVAAVLEREGDRRFEARVALLRTAVRTSGLDQALYETLLEALGYGGNAPQMLALARLLPWRTLTEHGGGGDSMPALGGTRASPAAGIVAARDRPAAREQRFAALLLGSAGLLPSQRDHDGPVEPYVDWLEATFGRAGLPALPRDTWKLWGVRPENAAARRVAAAAALLAALAAPSALLAVNAATTVNEAIAPFTVRASGYWLDHHDLCAGACRMPPSFVGRSRALEILINAVLPAACAADDAAISTPARALFAKLPRPAVYGLTRFIEDALASEGVKAPVNARRAQGLLELQRNWCTKGGCGRCSLSETPSSPASTSDHLLNPGVPSLIPADA